VVDNITNEVYGQVVASDVFGRAYVVPINDIFEDIKGRLSLETVGLPLEYAISEPGPDITAHSVGTLAGSRNDQQRANSHNVPMGSSPKQPLLSDTAEPRKAIPGPDHSHSPLGSSNPHVQKNARDANLIAPSVLSPSNTFQNNVGSPSSPTPANLADLDKAVYLPFQLQPYRVIHDQPSVQSNIDAYPQYNQCDLTFGSHIPIAYELPPQTEVDQPYIDSGYCTMNSSPAPPVQPAPPQLSKQHPPQQVQVFQPPSYGYPNQYHAVPQPGKPGDSVSPNVLNQESNPSGESRFQRLKAKMEQLWKKT
jgi:hypothetical protein